MANKKRRPLSGQGADIFFGTATEDTEETQDNETVKPSNSLTVPQSEEDDQVIKTSFYPTQAQLDKLDDLAGEYNRRYRRQRKRIDRQDIIRFLIDQCTLESLEDLKL